MVGLRLRTTLAAMLAVSSYGVAAQNQTAIPTNETMPMAASSYLSLVTATQPSLKLSIEPLTDAAGLGRSPVILTLSGFLSLVASDTQKTAQPKSIVYMPCDADRFDNALFNSTLSSSPAALLLYSTSSRSCLISSSASLTAVKVFTIVGGLPGTIVGGGAAALESRIIQSGSSQVYATINTTWPDRTSADDISPTSSTSPSATFAPVSGPAPTTQVAMIILYSITGLITGLFLIIIVTGAFRAHRHPERYGPRPMGRFGAMRQSRARGVARAVLDSIPIVKFSGNEPDEPKPETDVELAAGTQPTETKEKEKQSGTEGRPTESIAQEVDAVDAAVAAEAAATSAAIAAVGAGSNEAESSRAVDGDAIETAQPKISAETEQKGRPKPLNIPGVEDNSAICSICTEEFVKGDDQRLLPCHHAYHPACVDPWLLSNGTCPLCRIDLANDQPEVYQEEALPEAEEDEASQNPRRLSRLYFDMRRLNQAEPAERITALRRLRDQTRGLVASASPVPSFRRRSTVQGSLDEEVETSTDEDAAQRHRRSRLSGVLRRGRRNRDSAVAGASHAESGSSTEDVASGPTASSAVALSRVTAVPAEAPSTTAQPALPDESSSQQRQ